MAPLPQYWNHVVDSGTPVLLKNATVAPEHAPLSRLVFSITARSGAFEKTPHTLKPVPPQLPE